MSSLERVGALGGQGASRLRQLEGISAQRRGQGVYLSGLPSLEGPSVCFPLRRPLGVRLLIEDVAGLSHWKLLPGLLATEEGIPDNRAEDLGAHSPVATWEPLCSGLPALGDSGRDRLEHRGGGADARGLAAAEG